MTPDSRREAQHEISVGNLNHTDDHVLVSVKNPLVTNNYTNKELAQVGFTKQQAVELYQMLGRHLTTQEAENTQ